MKNTGMKAICLLLCLALCLTGAALAEDRRVAMGRYVETPIDLYGRSWLTFAQANGVIYAVDGSGEQLLRSKDFESGNWDSYDTGHNEELCPALGGVNGLTVAPDGTLYLSSGWAMINEDGYPYVERIQNSYAERIDLDQKLRGNTDALKLCALSDGGLLGMSDIEVYRFSSEGATLQKYAVSGGSDMAVYGGEFAVFSASNATITVLDIDTGETLRVITLPGPTEAGVIGYDANGALYYVCSSGLYQVNADSTLLVQIADGRLMTASKPSVWAHALLFDPNNDPIVAYSQSGSMTLIAYHYDETVATEPGTLLSVYALYDSQTLRECANKFQQVNPDIMVDITVALPKGTAITRDDAIRTLNTEILAGSGPDVMVLDGLPIESYIQQGVLMDLSEAVQPMIDSGELQANVAAAFQADGALPAVPTRFLLPTVWGEVSGLDSLSALAAWAQQNPEALPVYALDPERLISTFYLSCAPAWMNAGGRLDEERIAEFLSALQAIRGGWTYEAAVQVIGMDYKAEMATNNRMIAEWNPYDSSIYSIEEGIGGLVMMRGVQRQLPTLLRGSSSTSEVNGELIASKMDNGGFAALPGQAEGCFVPMLTLGASDSSANRESALAFITYALSANAQDVTFDGECGFPINIGALDALLVESWDSGISMSAGTPDGLYWEYTWLNQSQCGQLRQIIDALRTPVVVDFTLYQMLVNESLPFFEGQIDVNQAAQNVCARANAYLSE